MRPAAPLLAAALLAVGVAACGGCGRSEPPAEPPAETPAASPGQTHTYTVRGRIMSMPVEGQPGSELQVRHEEIADFVRRDGSLGMRSMAMPFPVGPGVSLEGLEPGDNVEFDFEVNYDARQVWQLTRIQKLPDDTRLEFDP